MTTDTTLESAWADYCDVAHAEAGLDNDADGIARFPEYTENGHWVRSSVDQLSRIVGDDYDHGNWSPGFWFGTRWLAGVVGERGVDHAVIDARWRHLATRTTDHTTHDLGFVFHPAVVLADALGLADEARQRDGITAAEQLARRFNHHGDYLQAFGPIGHVQTAGTSTMDTMMNLPLLWWAGALEGRESLITMAKRHARSTTRAFFRPDGSTYHLVRYDPADGAVVWRGTFQGSDDASCWSRGQAWAVAGYAWAWLATGEGDSRDVAERAADWFLENLPADRLPPWDFGQRDDPDVTPDASAGAITALGLLILAGDDQDPVAQGHRTAARDLLGRCAEQAQNRDGSVDGLLPLSCYSLPHDKGVRGATAWGDFYYGLALALATGRLTTDHLRAAPSSLTLRGGAR